ncbi:MAG TPA: PDZ domain-containing protein [Nitrospirota bacterium]|nr:PDZ domain-containing protein [Nitrospirota bacterium]
MKKYCSCLFLAIVLCSCGGRLSLSPKELRPGTFSYCELLNVPSQPYPVLKPKPYLGIYLASRKLEQAPSTCKENYFVQVAGIINGSPADKAGLKDDDVILSLNNNPVCGDAVRVEPLLKKMIEREKIGSLAVLDILRGDRTLSLSVILEEQPTHEQREAMHPDMGTCPTQTSLLGNALSAQGALPALHAVYDGLYERSNSVHNPGSALEKKSHPLQLEQVTYLMRHPLEAGEVAKELSRGISEPFENEDPAEGVRRAAALLDVSLPSPEKPEEITFPALLHVMEETTRSIDAALSNLTPEEKKLLQDKALDPSDDSQWNRILEVSLKVDRAALFRAFTPLLAFLTRDNLSLLKADLIQRFGGNKGPILYEAMSPIGKVIVGGEGPNVYTEDAALILDLGGDDVYLNNAGGTRPGMPLALVIDWGGNDRYITKENFSQGAGLLGGGFLIDLGGNDTFIARDGSQGAGFWGLGFLYHGDGNGIFSAREFAQGTGQMGIGILVNRKGDDRYLCSYGGQGLGLFGGAGILFDEAGNDFYQLGGLEPDFRDPSASTQSMGQGFGLGERPEKDKDGVPGGVGMLIDSSGDDTYIADYFAQGASYYYGLGILDDRAGNDQYISGRYSQGAGIHSSIGVLLDRAGNDFYYDSFGVGQGMGHDYGVGFFEDDGGEDHYQGGSLVQGAATNGGLGIFIDLTGKREHSFVSEGQAYVEGDKGIGISITRGLTADAPAIKFETGKE